MIIDTKGFYYINCIVYESSDDLSIDTYQFEVQFIINDRAINISTVNWFGDYEEKYRKYPTIQEVEKMFEKLYKAYIN
jgi:hypothetical protein